MLEVRDLSIQYENNATVKDVSFAVADGEIYSIIGRSGSRKSTILNAVSGMLGRNGRITSGTIRFARSPMHSRINALGQNHHLVLLPIPSAVSPARFAQIPLRNT